MNKIKIKEKSSFLKYHDEFIEFKNSIEDLELRQKNYIELIFSILDIRRNCSCNGKLDEYLNSLIIDFLDSSYKYYISESAFKKLINPEYNLPLLIKEVFNSSEYSIENIIPYKNIIQNLIIYENKQTNIFNLLFNLRNRIILLQEENDIFKKKFRSNGFGRYQEMFNKKIYIDNIYLENLIGIKINREKIILIK